MAAASTHALLERVDTTPLRMGAIKKVAKEVKRDHAAALALWATGNYAGRLLAVLIMDKKELTQDVVERLAADIRDHDAKQRRQIIDWLLANQLMKSKKTVDLLLSWQDHPEPQLRRLFWYHQGRLRWTGQKPPENSAALLDAAEQDLAGEDPDVQWAMNFCVAWIGVYQPELRPRCVALGENTGLFRDERVVRGCTPNYLPEFIRIEAGKRDL